MLLTHNCNLPGNKLTRQLLLIAEHGRVEPRHAGVDGWHGNTASVPAWEQLSLTKSFSKRIVVDFEQSELRILVGCHGDKLCGSEHDDRL